MRNPSQKFSHTYLTHFSYADRLHHIFYLSRSRSYLHHSHAHDPTRAEKNSFIHVSLGKAWRPRIFLILCTIDLCNKLWVVFSANKEAHFYSHRLAMPFAKKIVNHELIRLRQSSIHYSFNRKGIDFLFQRTICMKCSQSCFIMQKEDCENCSLTCCCNSSFWALHFLGSSKGHTTWEPLSSREEHDCKWHLTS